MISRLLFNEGLIISCTVSDILYSELSAIPQNKSHIILIIFLRLSLNIPLFDKVAYNIHIIAIILPIIKINMDILLIIYIKHQCPYLFDEIHWRIHHVMEFLFTHIAN